MSLPILCTNSVSRVSSKSTPPNTGNCLAGCQEGPVDVVLGVSVTTTAVRMVLIEGEKADGVTVESGTLDTVAVGGAVKASPSEQISADAIAQCLQRLLVIPRHTRREQVVAV